MRWRVVVDYNYNSVALYANSKEERDHLAAKLRDTLEQESCLLTISPVTSMEFI